jgi:hypothetical protein
METIASANHAPANKENTIIVNAQEKRVTAKELTFDQVVDLAFPGTPRGGNWVFTVTYRKGDGKKAEGTLTSGESIKIKDGTVFNVTATDKS